MADSTSTMPDFAGVMSGILPEYMQGSKDVAAQIGNMQDWIKSTQAQQANLPALAFAAGLLKPTRTGSFGESMGNAGEGALGALAQQRSIDMDRESKLMQLAEAKQTLLGQQLQTVAPFYKMQLGAQAMDAAPGASGPGAGSPSGASSAGTGDTVDTGNMPAATPSMTDIAARTAKYKQAMSFAVRSGDQAAVEAISNMMRYDPYLKGAAAGQAKAAEMPYELVEKKNPDGSITMVPKSTLLPGGSGARAPAPASGGTGAPPPAQAATSAPGNQVAPSSYDVADRDALIEANKSVPDNLSGLYATKASVQHIDDIMKDYQSGSFNDVKAKVVADINGAFGKDTIKNTDTFNANDFQALMKEKMGLIFNQLGSLKGRVLDKEITGLGAANFDPLLQPAAARSILARTMGTTNYNIDYNSDIAKKFTDASKGGATPQFSAWSADWHKAHNPLTYFDKAYATMPVKGMGPTELQPGQYGVADDDVMGADAKGRSFPVVKKGGVYVKTPDGGITSVDDWQKHFLPKLTQVGADGGQ